MSNQNTSYEIEIKSLLGDSSRANALRDKLKARDPKLKVVEQSKQLNHYFVEGDLKKLEKNLLPHLTPSDQEKLHYTLENGKKVSVRTRQMNDKVIVVVKASIDDTTSSNGISRLEFEAEMSDLTLEQLDQVLLDSGLKYQAKWSREREAYRLPDEEVTVCIDKNAGYGYLAEFEAVVPNADQAEEIKQKLRSLMDELETEELAQDRLERMFAHYNAHWPEYYGTDKVFTIE